MKKDLQQIGLSLLCPHFIPPWANVGFERQCSQRSMCFGLGLGRLWSSEPLWFPPSIPPLAVPSLSTIPRKHPKNTYSRGPDESIFFCISSPGALPSASLLLSWEESFFSSSTKTPCPAARNWSLFLFPFLLGAITLLLTALGQQKNPPGDSTNSRPSIMFLIPSPFLLPPPDLLPFPK